MLQSHAPTLRYAGPDVPIIVTPSPAEDPDDIIEQEVLLVAHAFNDSGESDEEESGLEQIVEHARIVGTLNGTLISKSEENLWDIDIKKVGLSHSHQKACRPKYPYL